MSRDDIDDYQFQCFTCRSKCKVVAGVWVELYTADVRFAFY